MQGICNSLYRRHPYPCGFIGNTTIEFQKQQGGSTQRHVLAGTDTEFVAGIGVIDRVGTRIGCVPLDGKSCVHGLYDMQRAVDGMAALGDSTKDRRS